MANFNNRDELKQFVQEALSKAEGATSYQQQYGMSFAQKANSGLSFGLYQNDVAANPDARKTFEDILRLQGSFSAADITRLSDIAARPGVTIAAFTRLEQDSLTTALSSDNGKRLINALDDKTVNLVTDRTSVFLDTLSTMGRYGTGVFDPANPDPVSLVAVVSWTNRTGQPPTTFASYLAGNAVTFNGSPHSINAAPTRSDVEFYLSNQQYFQVAAPNEFYGVNNNQGWWKKINNIGLFDTAYAAGELTQRNYWDLKGVYHPFQGPTGPADNSRLTIGTTTTLSPFDTVASYEAQAGQVGLGRVVSDPLYFAALPLAMVNGDGYWHTELGGIVTDGLRPGNFNLSDAFLNDIADEAIGGILNDPGLFDLGTSLLLGGGLNNWSADARATAYIDPLVLDLNGDGVKLTDYGSNPVLFDIDNDGGSLEQTGWVSPQDGLLVMDRNGNGKIDNISETFSEYFNGITGSGGNAGTKPYTDGFAALKSQDSNGDNVFNGSDTAFNNVRVWLDANHDGKTDAGELKTLNELGISQINLAAKKESGAVRDGNEILSSGTFIQAGIAKEALALNFLANPNGHSFVNSGSGTTTTTQGGVSSYTAGNAAGEAIDVTAKGVTNAYGAQGNDTLIGNAANNWLAGGAGSDSYSAGAGDDVLLIDADDLQQNIRAGAGTDIVQVIGDKGVTLNLAQAEVEVAVGGRGNDVFVSGGNSNTFVRAGDGDDLLLGGSANDALSGENGDDVIDGGAGNDLLRGHRGRDRILGGSGDDIIEGGQDDDTLSGGAGNDVIEGGQGDDRLDGGAGIDVAKYTGDTTDYRIVRTEDGLWISDRKGRDGTDFLQGVEKLSFANLAVVSIDEPAPLPVKDEVAMANRTTALVIGKAQLLSNDIDFQGESLSIREVLDAVGGTVALNANGDVVFTPDANFKGVMSFNYKVIDSQGHTGLVVGKAAGGGSVEYKASVYLKTPDLPADPQFRKQAWYMTDTNILPVWNDYTGKGVRIGVFESGGPYAVSPETFNYRNPDLAPNVDSEWLGQAGVGALPAAPTTFSWHATAVAGVIAAARNTEGTVGVAYNAKIAGHTFPSTGVAGTVSAVTSAEMNKFKNYDVVNNSWGLKTGNFESLFGTLPGVVDAVTSGRNGRGTAVVFAAGNDRQSGGNTNYSMLTNSPFTITVGSVNAVTDFGAGAQFSNPGASILVSAPGSFITSTSDMLINEEGTIFGAESTTENGTSVAAPIVSGVVALMLEANPRLGYRDIQDILALSATVVDPNNTSWGYYNGARTWNGGGMHVSHDYGFGQVDALAAVRLAETWTQQKTAQNLVAMPVASGTLNQAIPDGTGSLTKSLTMASGLEVEFAQVVVNIDHPRWGDLVVKLISPYGTESVLIDRPGKAPGSGAGVYGDTGTGTLNVALGSTHYRGEQSNGTWTLQVIDAATGQVGMLKDWKLTLTGKSTAGGNDTYVYTNEFSALGESSRATLMDTNGGIDTINAAAVSGNSSINLFSGTTSTIAGRALTVASMYIENAVGGDGNDALTGNDNNNNLSGGRGGDTLYGNGGRDILDGGAGNDTLYGGTAHDYFVIRKSAGSQDVIGDFSPEAAEKIIFSGFENLQDFSQIGRVAEGANLRLNLGNGQSVLLLNTSAAQFAEQSTIILPEDKMLDNLLGFLSLPLNYLGNNASANVGLSEQQGTAWGMGGDDTFWSGSHLYFIDAGDGNDTIQPYNIPGQDRHWFEGGTGNDWIQGGTNNDVIRGGSGLDQLYGDEGADFIEGGSGNDQLSGGNGNDVLIGGIGNDRLAGDAGDDVIILDGDQGEIWRSGGNQVISGAVGGSGTDWFWIMPNATSSYVYVSDYVYANNLIADFNVNDPNEKIDLSSIESVAGFGDLTFSETGPLGARITTINMGAGVLVNLYNVPASSLKASNFEFAKDNAAAGRTNGNDVLTGDAGGNLLDGRAGADVLTGRTGDDTYVVDNAGDVVNELPDGGFDTVRSSVTFALPADVENLVLTGVAAINGTGNAHVNRIEGNAAANRLDGGAGEDTLIGGAGNDIYVVDNTADRVVERAAGGYDAVESSVSYALPDEVEKLTLTGNLAVNATGNALNNTLVGNVNHNTLDGGAGADSMTGGDGDDTYLVDNAGDAVNEAAGQGVDGVYALLNYTLPNNVENVTLGIGVTAGTGNALDNVITGNSINNTLTGGAGNDVLDGGAGADTLQGGLGDDSYVVDNAVDAVVEALNEGIDTVEAAVSHTLVANVENLVLGGVGNLNGTGNTLNNTLIGNGGNNVLTGYAGDDFLDGAGGVDTLIGGAGNDVYGVDNLSEVVTELAGEGTDTVQSSITYTLGANVENLTLTGTLLINGTGNALDNVISGNDGNNNLSGLAGNDSLNGGTGNDTLNGGTGADSLMGSLGNDTYHIDNSLDVITENAGEGTDTVLVTGTTFTSYTLGVNMENLNFSLAPSMINGTGNELGNVISGNTGNNNLSGGVGNDTLNGRAGNDILDGGLGSDRLNGGTGNDTYLLGRGYGGETVTENDATTGNTDVAQFLSDIAIDQIWFRRLSNNLEVSVIGTNDKLTIGNWYSGNAYHIEQFKTAGGKTLLDSQVDNLVNAMAAFAPPAAGQTTLPPNYQTQLNPVIAANWQ